MVSSPNVPSWSTKTFVLARGTCTFLTFGLEGGVVDTVLTLLDCDELDLFFRNNPPNMLLRCCCCGLPSKKLH